MENEVQPTILVTGFGPFGNYKINASWEAVKLLPELFITWEKSSNVKLVIEEIPVAYKHVSYKVKELWEKHKPSVIVHVGVSYLADCLTIECQASSKGYVKSDIFEKCPEEEDVNEVILKSKCNAEKICEVINGDSHVTNCKARTSNDAGRFLCEYIYYQSLSIGEPLVLFVHVPELQIYSSEKTAQGLLKILIHLIEYAMGEECSIKK